MSMEDYEKAVMLINNSETSDFEGVKPESLVVKAEVALGVKFPPSYRRFLLELGCGDFNGVELYGIIGEDFTNSSVPDAIWLTLEERSTSNLKKKYVIVGSGGDGTYHAIDTSQPDNEGESPIVVLSLDGEELEVIARSFGAYLLNEISSVD